MSVRRRKFAAAGAVRPTAAAVDLTTLEARRRAETAALELRLVKWIVGTGVTGAGLVVAALRLFG